MSSELLQRAIELHSKGDEQEAKKLYLDLKTSGVENPDIFNNLGVIYLGEGNYDEARVCFTRLKSITNNQNHVKNIFIFYLKTRNILEAKSISLKNTQIQKFATYALMALERKQKIPANECDKLIKTINSFSSEKITKIHNMYPYCHVTNNVIGTEYLRRKNFTKAIYHLTQGILDAPHVHQLHYNLGNVYTACRSYEAAIAAYTKAIDINSDYKNAFLNRGNAYKSINSLKLAEADYRNVIAIDAKNVDALSNLGDLLKSYNKFDDAKILFKRVLEHEPNHLSALHNLGVTYEITRDKEKAQKCFQEVLKHYPNQTETLYQIVNGNYPSLIKSVRRKLLELENNPSITDIEAAHITFALAKTYEDEGDYRKTWQYYKKGNELVNTSNPVSSKTTELLLKKIRDLNKSLELYSLTPPKTQEPRPIFIVGMPRSGTSLLEQMLSAHSEIYGAGELPYLSQLCSKSVLKGDINLTELTEIAESYRFFLKKLNTHKPFIVDKMPQNFQFTGIILSAFPDALVINLHRDRKAVVWSNFRKLYERNANLGFSYDLDNCIQYHNFYTEIMEPWKQKNLLNYVEIEYETLTQHPRESLMKIFSRISMQLEEKCLFPERNQRAVNTASREQVEKPIFQNSSSAWKAYREFLDPYFERNGWH